MAKIIVVGFDLSKERESLTFKQLTFDEQLSLIEDEINNVCKQLSTKGADSWIIAWQEYGLSNLLGEHGGRFIDLEQKAKLKQLLKKLSTEHPKLTIISGSVASAREIDAKKQPNKISEVKEYESTFFFENKPKFFVVRNTAYVAHKGIIARHDKTQDYFEVSKFSPRGAAMFRPGSKEKKGAKEKIRGQSKIDEMIGIEICMEHRYGVLAAEILEKKAPLIQFILSDSTSINPKYRVSPYLIHIDSKEQFKLITEKSEQETEVEFYYHNVLSPSELIKIKPIPMKAIIFSNILDFLTESTSIESMNRVKTYINECHLDSVQYSGLISLITEQYLLGQCEPVSFYTIRGLIVHLLSLPSASNLSLDKKTRNSLIDIASNSNKPDSSFIQMIKAIPVHEEVESKQEAPRP